MNDHGNRVRIHSDAHGYKEVHTRLTLGQIIERLGPYLDKWSYIDENSPAFREGRAYFRSLKRALCINGSPCLCADNWRIKIDGHDEWRDFYGLVTGESESNVIPAETFAMRAKLLKDQAEEASEDSLVCVNLHLKNTEQADGE